MKFPLLLYILSIAALNVSPSSGNQFRDPPPEYTSFHTLVSFPFQSVGYRDGALIGRTKSAGPRWNRGDGLGVTAYDTEYPLTAPVNTFAEHHGGYSIHRATYRGRPAYIAKSSFFHLLKEVNVTRLGGV
jgi:hypothetical protein